MNIEYCNESVEDEEGNHVEKENHFSSIAINLNKIKLKKFSEKIDIPFHDVSDFIKTETSDDGYFEYCSESNYIFHRYQITNGFHPCVYKFEDLIDSTKFINNLFKYYKVPDSSYIKLSLQDSNQVKITTFIIAFSKDLLLYFDGTNEGSLYYNILDENKSNSLFNNVLGLLKSCKTPKISKNKIYVVYRNSHGFDKIGFDIKKIKIDLSENYNDGFIDISEKIIDGLNNRNKTNLVILQGDPGVGKSSFIRFLTSKLKKNIIFVSPDMVDSITDPAFIPFLMKNNDSILVIEDAEPALEQRSGTSRSSAVSNVLNLTDGLLSDCLNISIIATFNTDKKNIDNALLRKGRLLMNYKFEKLSVEKSKKLLEKLGFKNADIKEPMTLADIYYYGTNNTTQNKTIKIGFGNNL